MLLFQSSLRYIWYWRIWTYFFSFLFRSARLNLIKLDSSYRNMMIIFLSFCLWKMWIFFSFLWWQNWIISYGKDNQSFSVFARFSFLHSVVMYRLYMRNWMTNYKSCRLFFFMLFQICLALLNSIMTSKTTLLNFVDLCWIALYVKKKTDIKMHSLIMIDNQHLDKNYLITLIHRLSSIRSCLVVNIFRRFQW